MTPWTHPVAHRDRPDRRDGRAPATVMRLLRGPAVLWLAGSLVVAASLSCGALSAAAARDAWWVGLICFTASVASLLPVAPLAAGPVARWPLGLLATVAIRGGLTVLLLVGSIAAGWIDRGSVAVAVALWYASLLVVDLLAVNGLLTDTLSVSVRADSERTPC